MSMKMQLLFTFVIIQSMCLFTFVIIQSMCSFINTQVGESCTLKGTNQEGTCKIMSQCPFVLNRTEMDVNVTLCGFEKQVIPIVCCPVNNNRASTTLSLSEQKCEEYSKPITELHHLISLDALGTELLNVTTIARRINIKKPVIAGGQPTELGEFPFMALVGFNTTDSPWKCGGTLISERYILTAAHCTFWSDLVPTKVRLGEHDLSFDGPQHMDYPVSSIIVHPSYDWPKKYNDIALLRTQTTVIFKKFIRPACLATGPSIETLETGNPLAVGWGKTGFAKPPSDKLLKVYLEIFDNGICNRYYNIQDVLPNGIISSMLCVGEPRNSTIRKDTCLGDSGGPLLVKTNSNVKKFYVVGITSFGKACGLSKIPAVYTRVSKYISWIEEQVW